MVPREQAFKVYVRGEEVLGLLLYGLRGPDERPQVAIADASEPYELHGDGWAVDLWTIRADGGLPAGEEWQTLLQTVLGRLLEAGYQAAWFALEGDFADPPHLFDPDLMGQSVYAAATPETGFITHDDGEGELETLTDAELERLRGLATTVWPGAEAEL